MPEEIHSQPRTLEEFENAARSIAAAAMGKTLWELEDEEAARKAGTLPEAVPQVVMQAEEDTSPSAEARALHQVPTPAQLRQIKKDYVRKTYIEPTRAKLREPKPRIIKPKTTTGFVAPPPPSPNALRKPQ